LTNNDARFLRHPGVGLIDPDPEVVSELKAILCSQVTLLV